MLHQKAILSKKVALKTLRFKSKLYSDYVNQFFFGTTYCNKASITTEFLKFLLQNSYNRNIKLYRSDKLYLQVFQNYFTKFNKNLLPTNTRYTNKHYLHTHIQPVQMPN